jgi:hypothetical protein
VKSRNEPTLQRLIMNGSELLISLFKYLLLSLRVFYDRMSAVNCELVVLVFLTNDQHESFLRSYTSWPHATGQLRIVCSMFGLPCQRVTLNANDRRGYRLVGLHIHSFIHHSKLYPRFGHVYICSTSHSFHFDSSHLQD